MIRFNKPTITDLEREYVAESLNGSNLLSGDGKFTMKVYDQFKERFGIENMLLTTSGTTSGAGCCISSDSGVKPFLFSSIFIIPFVSIWTHNASS